MPTAHVDDCKCPECAQAFSYEFGGGLQPQCEVPCLDHCPGSLLDFDGCVPGACLPWKADMRCCEGWDGHDEHVQERATALAWRTMTRLTGGRVGSCCVMMRPCFREGPCDICMDAEFGLKPYIDANGDWRNAQCRPDDCSCCNISQITTPGPVAAITEVNIDGLRHDPRIFRVDDGRKIVRQDGCGMPSCQNMGAPYGYIGTFTVRYIPGVRPSIDGLWAVGVLACEFAKACNGDKCRLPTAVTSISRQGVSFELPRGMFDQGTGIREVDAYVHSLNPYGMSTPPRVWSPDLVEGKHRYTTTQIGGRWP